MDLTPLKVTITLTAQGSAKYPDFNSLQCVIDSNMDWSKYVDTHGLGWHYDKTSGHADSTVDSPKGQQFGVLVVPEVFATQAVSAFPECVKLTEVELQDFYDNKAHAHESDVVIDEKSLKYVEALQAKGSLTPKETEIINKILDPTDKTPGVIENRKKKWADVKADLGINIK